MSKLKDLTGMKFGRLTVIERAENRNTKVYWVCKCDCGNTTIVQGNLLKSGNTQSCGCLNKEKTSQRRFQDLTGQRFGRLTVIERAENAKNKQTRWLCRCSCGNECVILGASLKDGKTQSCGCLRTERAVAARTSHGMTRSSIYHVWQNIKDRCFNSNSTNYYLYGGRGITMYPAWIEDFQAFYDYVSKLEHFSEKGYSFDRIDNNGNYEPDNLRLSNQTTQNRNTRRNIIVDYNGESMPLVEASELSGINYNCLKRRHQRGDIGERLFRPVRHISR